MFTVYYEDIYNLGFEPKKFNKLSDALSFIKNEIPACYYWLENAVGATIKTNAPKELKRTD